jgi:hypothetical protein
VLLVQPLRKKQTGVAEDPGKSWVKQPRERLQITNVSIVVAKLVLKELELVAARCR